MFPGAQCSIVSKFQLLHSAKWQKCLLVPTSSNCIYCCKKKQGTNSHLAELQPNYSHPSAGIPTRRESREIRQPLSHVPWRVAAMCNWAG